MCASGSNAPRQRCIPILRRVLRFVAVLLCGSLLPLNAAQLEEHRVEDLEYGRSLFQFFQGDELGAITQLMIANERPEYRTRTQTDEANLLLADLYYGYGLYEESRDLFAKLLTAEVSDSVQNRIWFNLARLRFEQGYLDQARDLLARINDNLPDLIESERKYLLTNLYLGNQQYEEAADLSNRIDSGSIWKIYARYNLAVTRIEDDNYELGKNLLERIGQMDSKTPEKLALRDRANLSLGLKQLRLEHNEAALESLSRIRLEGPLSHQALLATGWARYRLNQFDKALIPWRFLLQRNAVDAATQEAILAIPSGYVENGQDQLALRHYEIAAKQFDAQLLLLNDSIASIENDGLIAALRENAILFDRGSLQRLPPSSDVTPQLHILLASTGFQREIKRYQELLDIRNSLRYWGRNFPALDLMLQERRQGFQRRLPRLQQSTSFDQLELLREQRDQFAKQYAEIEARKDHTAFATLEEQEHIERLERVSRSIDKVGGQRNTVYQQDMLRLLSGLLRYQLATEYPQRSWKAKKQLIHLERALAEAEYRVNSLLQIAERTELNFDYFQQRIDSHTQRISNLRSRVSELLGQQEKLINSLAIASIRQQQQHIVQLRLNARFELAKLYDKLAAEQ
ncbi:MAG: tetratricopeptide repeat protein [Gammaproteobacteria bacterium]|nr:tetratricopeptide repeat protein [Gammaproteobacteria bacterium]